MYTFRSGHPSKSSAHKTPHMITALLTIFPVLDFTSRDCYNWRFLNPFRLFCPSAVGFSDGLFQGASELSVRGPLRTRTFYTAHPFPFSCSPLNKYTDGLSARPVNGPISKHVAHIWGFVGAVGPPSTALRNGQHRQDQQLQPTCGLTRGKSLPVSGPSFSHL